MEELFDCSECENKTRFKCGCGKPLCSKHIVFVEIDAGHGKKQRLSVCSSCKKKFQSGSLKTGPKPI